MDLTAGKTTKVLTTPQTQYQFKNAQGQIIKKPTVKKVGDDLWVFDENNLGEAPDVVLVDYYDYYAEAVFVGESAPVAETVLDVAAHKVGGTALSKMLLGVGGVGALASIAASNSDDDYKPSAADLVDTVIDKPIISFNPITDDNTININESKQNTQTVSGTVKNAQNGDVVEIKIGDKVLTTQVNNGTFSVDVDSQLLVNNTAITASISTTDSAGNRASASQNHSYTVDTTALPATVNITSVATDNVINKQDSSNPTQTIVGNISFDQSAGTVQSLTVVVNKKSYTATITNQSFSAIVDTADILADSSVTARLTVVDKAGNQTVATGNKSYTVDTDAPIVKIAIISIAGDNEIGLAEANQTVDIVGKVTGEFKAGDIATLKIGSTQYTKAVDSNGDFTVSVPADVLSKDVSKQVQASISTTDNAGNTTTATSAKAYTVEAPVVKGEIFVTIDKIANDGLINVSEAAGDVVVEGTVTGKDKLPNQTVQLSYGGTTLNVTADANGKFVANISGKALTDVPNYTISASVSGGNNAQNSTSKQYQVQAEAAASIDITSIDSDFAVDIAQVDQMVRITGRAQFDGDYADAKNLQLIRQVQVQIGDKSYEVGVRNGEFALDIKQSELMTLANKPISYTFKAETWKFVNGKVVNIADGKEELDLVSVEVPASLVSLDGAYTTTANGTTTIKSFANPQVLISGVVTGSAKVGDVIELNVKDQTISTTVLAGKRFEVGVDSSLINSDGDQLIVAKLVTQDLAKNTITVTDSEMFITAQKSPVNFVSGHTQDDIPSDYFVKDLGAVKYLAQSPYDISTYNIPVGGNLDGSTAQIKFYFGKYTDYLNHANELNSNDLRDGDVMTSTIREYPDDIKEIIRASYKQIAGYVNVEFVEVSSYDEADTRLFYADFATENTLAFAFHGGNLWWNGYAVVNDVSEFYYTALHEISHTLNMTHSSDEMVGALNVEETSEFTYMSYRADVNNSMFKNMKELRIYDLAYLHYQLGVNKNARAGDDTYTFKEYDMFASDGARYIWDGAGVDTFDASRETQGVTVNLTPGTWSYVGTKSNTFLVASQTVHKDYETDLGNGHVSVEYTDDAFYNGAHTENTYTQGQVYIGYDTQIENLVGSNHNDTLTGNDANNIIYGGLGDDTIDGGLGDDFLDGGLGNDTLIGGAGDDVYVIDSATDKIVENSNAGDDWVYSTVNYTLSDNVDNLVLLGTQATSAVGNALDNWLVANNIGNTLNGGAGNDTLIGGLGTDTLIGGAGNDIFMFVSALNGAVDTISDFLVGADTIALSAEVFAGLTIDQNSNVFDFISYNKQTGVLSYDADGAGGADAIDFANIGANAALQVEHFVVI